MTAAITRDRPMVAALTRLYDETAAQHDQLLSELRRLNDRGIPVAHSEYQRVRDLGARCDAIADNIRQHGGVLWR